MYSHHLIRGYKYDIIYYNSCFSGCWYNNVGFAGMSELLRSDLRVRVGPIKARNCRQVCSKADKAANSQPSLLSPLSSKYSLRLPKYPDNSISIGKYAGAGCRSLSDLHFAPLVSPIIRPCFATRECWYLSVFEYQYLFIKKISVSVIFIY